MVVVLKEIQPTDTLPPVSTSGMDYSASAPPTTQPHSQVMETSLGMDTSLGLQPPSQTFSLPQAPEFAKTCSSKNIQALESNPPPEAGGISVTPSTQTSSNLLALPPDKNKEETENNNLEDIKTKISKPLDASQIPIENQDEALLPLQIPDIHQLRECTDTLGQENQPCPENTHLKKNSLCLEDQGTLGHESESSGRSANLPALVGHSHLPQLFSAFKDLDQSKGPKVIKAKGTKTIELNQVRERSCAEKGSSGQARKSKRKVSETLSGAPKAKIQPKDADSLLGGDVSICSVADGDKAPVTTSKHCDQKSPKAPSSKTSTTRSHEQEKTKRTRKSNSKEAAEGKESRSKVTAEEKPTVSKIKWKKNEPNLSQENFKKP
ncbi:hypothetical protein MUG91_G139n43 [Manis pentadactyla]|nr:hypothetical protein MUG91_G139n43 [Manis pentadactyla]